MDHRAVVTAFGQDLTIRTRVPLVVAPATVTDGKGRFIDGLRESDFVLLDNGRSRPLHMDTSDIAQIPISIVIAVQSNGFSGPALAKIRKVGSMVEPLITGKRGEAAVIRFSEKIETLQDFTSDAGLITRAFRSLRSDGRLARAIDAVAYAIDLLRSRPENRRKIVLLISESRDRGSESDLAGVLQSAQRRDVTVYTLTFSVHAMPWTSKPSNAPPSPGGFDILAVIRELGRLGKTNTAGELARFTGGQRLSFLTQRGLETEIARVGEELQSQYLLSFTPIPANGAEAFHTIEVKVKGRPDLVIHTRPGYWPLSP